MCNLSNRLREILCSPGPPYYYSGMVLSLRSSFCFNFSLLVPWTMSEVNRCCSHEFSLFIFIQKFVVVVLINFHCLFASLPLLLLWISSVYLEVLRCFSYEFSLLIWEFAVVVYTLEFSLFILELVGVILMNFYCFLGVRGYCSHKFFMLSFRGSP